MGKQEDFVLRALEERDVRFVRLWFTDVLGSLKSVAIAPAELEGAVALPRRRAPAPAPALPKVARRGPPPAGCVVRQHQVQRLLTL